MNQLEYRPGLGGAAVQMDDYPAFVGTAENLRSREWSYTLGYRDLVSANRPAREVEVDFHTDYNVANALRRVADADVMAKTPGTFVAQGEWKQRGYILASTPSDIHFGRLMANMRVALLDGAWWRLASKTCMPDSGTTPSGTKSGRTVTLDDAASAPLQGLTVYGECVQDGTPTPSAPVAIDVVRGANLWDSATYPLTNNKYVNTTGGISGSTSNRNAATQGYVPCAGFAGLDITLNQRPDGATPGFAFYDSSKTFISGEKNDNGEPGTPWTVSVPSTAVYMRFTTVYNATDVMLNVGTSTMPYVPYGAIGIAVTKSGTTTITSIDLGGNVLASLPDGTQDVLTVAEDGSASIAKSVGVTTTASTDGVTGTVGVDVLSTTGQIADGPTVYYKLTTTQTVSLASVTMPQLSSGATVETVAEVQPMMDVVYPVVPYLDYAYDYEYDYYVSSSDTSVETSVLTPSNIKLTIYGAATNPAITIGGNVYQVNTTVPSGGYLTVDGREKTIVLTLANGTTQNAFADGVRGTGAGGGSYIFEPIKSGLQSVSWDGSFGFDLGWYEEEGEPPWSLS